MLSVKEVDAIDSSGLYKDYEEWPNHCKVASTVKINQPLNYSPKNIFFVGLGGSGAPGDILKNWLSPILNIPFIVLKNYELPKFVGKKDLIIIVSCSGNTEEILHVIDSAYRKDYKIEAIFSGGILEKFCIKNNISFTKIKKLRAPRSSFPYLFYTVAAILKKMNLLNKVEKQLISSVISIKDMHKKISIHTPINKNPAKTLATKIYNGLPIIYVSSNNSGLAERFKALLNENAKMLVHTAIIPELCYNEIEIWKKNDSRNYIPIFIRNSEESPKIIKRFKLIKEIINDANYQVNEIWETGKDFLSQTLSTLYFLDYVSIYTAILRKEDPQKTISLDKIKKSITPYSKEINQQY